MQADRLALHIVFDWQEGAIILEVEIQGVQREDTHLARSVPNADGYLGMFNKTLLHAVFFFFRSKL